MEYIITLFILAIALFIFYKRLKNQEKCSKCAENGTCFVGLRDCNFEEIKKEDVK